MSQQGDALRLINQKIYPLLKSAEAMEDIDDDLAADVKEAFGFWGRARFLLEGKCIGEDAPTILRLGAKVSDLDSLLAITPRTRAGRARAAQELAPIQAARKAARKEAARESLREFITTAPDTTLHKFAYAKLTAAEQAHHGGDDGEFVRTAAQAELSRRGRRAGTGTTSQTTAATASADLGARFDADPSLQARWASKAVYLAATRRAGEATGSRTSLSAAPAMSAAVAAPCDDNGDEAGWGADWDTDPSVREQFASRDVYIRCRRIEARQAAVDPGEPADLTRPSLPTTTTSDGTDGDTTGDDARFGAEYDTNDAIRQAWASRAVYVAYRRGEALRAERRQRLWGG